jgi:Tol biopolymer transport system component
LPCSGTECPNLIVAQSGQAVRVDLSAQGIQPAAPFALPGEQAQNGRWTIDTGAPSPDGQWAAYTTIGNDSGGPVLLQNLATGEWINLIDRLNARLPGDQPAFPIEAWWDVIGWFPDSARLMIGPGDLSQVLIVDLAGFTARAMAFPGGGRGGRLFVGLAPDGSRFTYIGEDAAGNQMLNAVDLTSGQTVTLLELPYAEGVLYNPRYSPDHQQIAYLLQVGRPATGFNYAISLLSPVDNKARVLVEGNLGPTVPVWSPDGSYIAYTRNEGSEPYRVLPNASPRPQSSNVWVVSLADGKQTRITSLEGQARSPQWAKDNRLLAYITDDGQVQMADITRPGDTWQVAGPSPAPELTMLFFLP